MAFMSNILVLIFQQDLEEDCAQVYSSSVAILRNLARYNIQLRHDFAINYQLYCCILKGMCNFNRFIVFFKFISLELEALSYFSGGAARLL